VHTGKNVRETTRRQKSVSKRRIFLDLSEDVSKWCPPRHVSVAYLCAAVTPLEQCYKEVTQSTKVNVHSTFEIANALVKSGTFVIFPSTNLVFDGSIPFQKANNPLSPQTEHGRQKAKAESMLLSFCNLISVVRFTKIIENIVPLLKNWIKTLQNNKVIHPLSDKKLSPLPLSFVVNVLLRIAEERLQGIIQVSGEKDVTYEDIGYFIAQYIGANPSLVQPVKSKDLDPQMGMSPSHTTLDTKRLHTELCMKPPDIWKTINTMIANIINHKD